jgi:predicted transcriptional regulator
MSRHGLPELGADIFFALLDEPLGIYELAARLGASPFIVRGGLRMLTDIGLVEPVLLTQGRRAWRTTRLEPNTA